MPEITFPNTEPRYLVDLDCLEIRADVDGKPVDCLVTGELLHRRFGAKDLTEGEMREAYRTHSAEIQNLVRSQIENGWIDQANRVLLTTRHTRLHVSFGNQLGLRTLERSLAETAHRVLLDLIGPTAEEVSVEWDRAEDRRGKPAITLRLTDPSIPWSVSAILEPKDWEDLAWLQVHLARLWSSLLQGRSRYLMLKSG